MSRRRALIKRSNRRGDRAEPWTVPISSWTAAEDLFWSGVATPLLESAHYVDQSVGIFHRADIE